MEVFDIQGNKVSIGDKVRFVSYYTGKIPKSFTQGSAEVIEITNRGTVVYQHSLDIEPHRVSKDIFAGCARLV